ncbi:MAG: diphosphomevalonate decarboxylase [Gammaproteobacteria bacterium]
MKPTNNQARVVAHPNIALVKYWGKASVEGNIPAVASLSITLDTLVSETKITLHDKADDEIHLNGEPATNAVAARISRFLDLVWMQSDDPRRAQVHTDNNFPTAAGLASSASGFAALALAAAKVYNVDLDDAALSALARQGSGSAARSVFGGFVEMQGPKIDNPCAVPLLDADQWPLRVVVAITSTQAKTHLSTDGMNLTRDTSPFYGAWVDSQHEDMARAKSAVNERDFQALAAVSEYSCLKMHGLMLSAQPGLVYWNAATLACLHKVRELRDAGLDVFFTIDAGPQVKAVCTADAVAEVRAALNAVPGVVDTLEVGLGAGAQLVQ